MPKGLAYAGDHSYMISPRLPSSTPNQRVTAVSNPLHQSIALQPNNPKNTGSNEASYRMQLVLSAHTCTNDVSTGVASAMFGGSLGDRLSKFS
jgi:hypothetical protein